MKRKRPWLEGFDFFSELVAAVLFFAAVGLLMLFLGSQGGSQ